MRLTRKAVLMTPKTGSCVKITFKSDDFAELNFVREYAEGFHVDDSSQTREAVLRYLEKSDSYSVEIELSLEFLRKVFDNDLEALREFGNNIDKNSPAIMGTKSFPITPAM